MAHTLAELWGHGRVDGASARRAIGMEGAQGTARVIRTMGQACASGKQPQAAAGNRGSYRGCNS